jgi:hypothetical protein
MNPRSKRILKINIFFSILFIIIISFITFWLKISRKIYLSAIFAILLTFLNFLIGFYIINKGIKKENKSFLILVLGGMVGRLFLMLTLIIIGLKILFLNQYYFIFTLFIFYIYYQIVEIFYLNRIEGLIVNTK